MIDGFREIKKFISTETTDSAPMDNMTVKGCTMYAVTLLRRRNNKDEEYGRIVLKGDRVEFQGLSSVFQAYLQQGIVDGQQVTRTPRDGIAFLKNLKHHRFDHGLRATDMQEIPATGQPQALKQVEDFI